MVCQGSGCVELPKMQSWLIQSVYTSNQVGQTAAVLTGPADSVQRSSMGRLKAPL